MNKAHDLFLLMFNLTQVHNKAKIIEMFLEGLNEIFKPAVFHFAKDHDKAHDKESSFEIEIRTRKSYFGLIRIAHYKSTPKEHLPLLQNAAQMLAIILERLYFDRQLQKEKSALEQIADERNKELQKKIKEIEQARNASLNLVEDLTEEIKKRTQYEKELKESEERFRSIYENLAVGLAQVSLDFKIINANEAYCKMLGYCEDELAGKYLNDITHPEVLEENMQKQKLLAAGKIDHYRMEKKFIHKNGETITGILDANLIRDVDGKGIYFLGSVVDITERKEAEKELHLLKDNLQAEVDRKTKELNERVEILERFQEATVEREFRIKELKEEMQRLKDSQSKD